MSFHLSCESFSHENQKTFKVRNFRKYDEETENFEKKTLSLFKKASPPKWEGAKFAGGSRPSCFNGQSNCRTKNTVDENAM